MTEYTCFECGSEEDIHLHHVVPKSLGGTKMIPLCSKCHSLVHSRDLTRSTNLIKQAHKTRRRANLVCGHPPYGFSRGANDELVANPEEGRVWAYVEKLRQTPNGKKAGHSWRVIAAKLNEQGLKNRSGRDWNYRTLQELNKTRERWKDFLKNTSNKKPF